MNFAGWNGFRPFFRQVEFFSEWIAGRLIFRKIWIARDDTSGVFPRPPFSANCQRASALNHRPWLPLPAGKPEVPRQIFLQGQVQFMG